MCQSKILTLQARNDQLEQRFELLLASYEVLKIGMQAIIDQRDALRDENIELLEMLAIHKLEAH